MIDLTFTQMAHILERRNPEEKTVRFPELVRDGLGILANLLHGQAPLRKIFPPPWAYGGFDPAENLAMADMIRDYRPSVPESPAKEVA